MHMLQMMQQQRGGQGGLADLLGGRQLGGTGGASNMFSEQPYRPSGAGGFMEGPGTAQPDIGATTKPAVGAPTQAPPDLSSLVTEGLAGAGPWGSINRDPSTMPQQANLRSLTAPSDPMTAAVANKVAGPTSGMSEGPATRTLRAGVMDRIRAPRPRDVDVKEGVGPQSVVRARGGFMDTGAPAGDTAPQKPGVVQVRQGPRRPADVNAAAGNFRQRLLANRPTGLAGGVAERFAAGAPRARVQTAEDRLRRSQALLPRK